MSDAQLRLFVIFLCVCLSIALFFDGYLYFKDVGKSPQEEHHSTFFSFVFGPAQQNLTEGNLYLNLTFNVVEGNLTVTAEVNTDSYNRYAALALQFDSDNNGTIDIRYWPEENIYYYDAAEDDLQFLLRADNETRPSMSTYWGWLPDGTIYCYTMVREPIDYKSPYHYCIFNDGVYTFHFTYRTNNPNLSHFAIQGKLVRVLYGIVPLNGSPAEGMAVYVPPFKFME